MAAEKLALYFGCRAGSGGHFLGTEGGTTLHTPRRTYPDFPWDDYLMDTGLLRNGKHPDVVDGKVFWTCGGRDALWFAFFWWDRSGDNRANSCSGFYVRGFDLSEIPAEWSGGSGKVLRDAFAYACERFPLIVARQHRALVLQEK